MSIKSPIVLGVEFIKEKFPNLYKIAVRNPDGLKVQLLEWAATSGSTNLQSVAIALEHDLEHELRTVAKDSKR